MPGLSSIRESFLGLGLGDLGGENKLSGCSVMSVMSLMSVMSVMSVMGLRPSLMMGILLGDLLSFILGSRGL